MELGVTLEGQARKLDEGDWQLKVGVGKSPRKFMHVAVVGSNPFCAKPTNRKERKKPSCIKMKSVHRRERPKMFQTGYVRGNRNRMKNHESFVIYMLAL
jgi:hypothetical protein